MKDRFCVAGASTTFRLGGGKYQRQTRTRQRVRGRRNGLLPGRKLTDLFVKVKRASQSRQVVDASSIIHPPLGKSKVPPLPRLEFNESHAPHAGLNKKNGEDGTGNRSTGSLMHHRRAEASLHAIRLARDRGSPSDPSLGSRHRHSQIRATVQTATGVIHMLPLLHQQPQAPTRFFMREDHPLVVTFFPSPSSATKPDPKSMLSAPENVPIFVEAVWICVGRRVSASLSRICGLLMKRRLDPTSLPALAPENSLVIRLYAERKACRPSQSAHVSTTLIPALLLDQPEVALDLAEPQFRRLTLSFSIFTFEFSFSESEIRKIHAHFLDR